MINALHVYHPLAFSHRLLQPPALLREVHSMLNCRAGVLRESFRVVHHRPLVCQPKIIALRSRDVRNWLLSALSERVGPTRGVYRSLNDITRNLASGSNLEK